MENSNKSLKENTEVVDVLEDKQKSSLPDTPDINVDKYVKMGIFVIVLVFGIIAAWSAFARLATGVSVPGQVMVEANKKVIQHLEGGIVESINVKDGDFVKKGDVLVRLSEVKARATLRSYMAKYYETLALEARLVAENRNKSKINFPKELDSLEKSKKDKLIKVQREIFGNEMASLKKERKVTSQNIESFNNQIKGLKEVIKSKETLLKSFQKEADEQQTLYDEKLIDKTKLREVKRKIESIKSDILTNKTEILKAQIQIRKARTELSLKEESFFVKIRKQLQDAQTKIEDLRARMTEVKDKLSRTTIKAPVNGTVLDLQIHTIGAIIAPGKPIMEIVPDNSKLIIEARLSPQHIDYAKVGLKANMTFPAFQLKGRFIHNIEGEVIFVAADSTVDKKGRSFYKVKLVVDKEGKEVLKKEHLTLLPGMPASVVIKIGSQTPLEYLLKPMTIMLDKAFLEE